MNKNNTKLAVTIVSGVCIALAFLLEKLGISELVVNSLNYLAIVSGGYFVAIDAFRGLYKQRFLNINFLVTVAALGAMYINQLGEAASVVFFFSLAEAFERYGVERSRKALETLIKKSPQIAVMLDGSKVSVDAVKIKDVITVRPGDIIPLDGIVLKGTSSVDEATITGEPIPKDKREGDTVFASTLNRNGYLEIEVTKESKDSTFSKIVKLVAQAQSSRAPAQDFVDKFAKYYTPSIVVAALLIVAVPTLFFGGVFTEWLYRALVLLVIACPCSLVISTPVSIASAIGGASRKGILIKGGKFLEALSKVKAVAFDKTRTLTMGEPYISDVVTFGGFTEEQVLSDAAGVEKFSSHPLSKSIVDFALTKGIDPHAMSEYENIAGKGGMASCLVCNDKAHCVGNLKLIGANSETTKEVLAKTEELEQQGKTVVLVSEGKKVMGLLAISDKLRPESKAAINALTAQKVIPAMLTGDNEHSAAFVGRELGITKIYASLLPNDKVTKIELLKKEMGSVAMVGDGVNDAPSLATANVGIAMGSGGSDVAIETADIALMNSDLRNIPIAIRLGKRTVRTIRQNITASLLVKAVFLTAALFGVTDLEYAIGADSILAILVIVNGLRLFSV